MAEAVDFWKFVSSGGPGNKLVGPDIASAASITITNLVHRISGAAAIGTIVPPDPNFCGFIVLIATGAWTWTSAGGANQITLASAAAQTVGKAVVFFYNPVTTFWSPVASAAT